MVSRTLPGDVSTEIVKSYVAPAYLIEIGFATPFRQSTGRDIDFGGNTFTEGGVIPESLSWVGNQQSGEIVILNGDSSGTALVLNNRVADVPIKIWKTYVTGPTTNTTPVLLLVGVGRNARITVDEVRVTVSESASDTEFAPQDLVIPGNGFNHLPRLNKVFVWQGEHYLLESRR